MLTDREIKHLWISLTSNCNFDCSYCYIAGAGINLSLDTALETVEQFMLARGDLKVLDFYGGEPLLRFDAMKRIVDSAVSASEKQGKQVRVRVATNGSLISDEFLEFARAHKIKISISIDGGADAHNRNRKFRNGGPTYETVASKCSEALAACGERYVQALMTITPELAPVMFDNMLEVISTGLKNFHINPVPTDSWPEVQKAAFGKSLVRILLFLRRRIESDDFIFFEPVSQAILSMTSDFQGSLKTPCPFYKRLAMLPSGSLALLPDLCFEGNLEHYSLGALSSIAAPYNECRFDPSLDLCRECIQKHRGINSGYELQTHMLRNAAAEKVSKKIVFQSKTSPLHKQYVDEAVHRTFE